VRKRVNNLKVYHFRFILVVSVVVILAFGIRFYWLTESRAEQVVVERIKDQELTLARSGALSISEFFKARKAQVLLLAEAEAIKKGRLPEEEVIMKDLYEQTKEQLVRNIVRVGKEGETTVSALSREIVFLGDRDYFLWAKKQKAPGEVFISEPVIARGGPAKGEWVGVMATPVFYQDEFNGVVFISFTIEDLDKTYITPLISSPKTKALIVTQDGTVVASSVPEAIGQNVVDYAQQSEWEGQEEYLVMARKALQGGEGSLVHNYYLFAPPISKQMKVATAYAPIGIGSQLWSLWITAPYEELVKFASPFRMSLTQGFIFALVGLLVLILVFVFGVRIAQRDGFLDGYVQARDGFEKKKK